MTKKKALSSLPLLLLLLFVLPPAATEAAPPSVSVPETVTGKAGSWITVRATTEGKYVRWIALDEEISLFPVDLLRDTKTAVLVCATPGKYRLLALTAAGDEISPEAVCTVVVTGGPSPPPPPPPTPVPPGPGPQPPPGPVVVVSKLWVIAVEETAEATPARAAFFTDKALAGRMREKGHGWRLFDKDVKTKDGTPPKELAPWLERAKGKKLPRLFLVAQDGTVLYEGDVPGTPAELLALIIKVGG